MKLTGKAGVATQALLREPQRRWQVHDLAKAAEVSVGLAHRVLARLERENLVEVEGAGPKRTCRVVSPRPGSPSPGEDAGAARLAPFITAIPITDIWVADTVALNDVAAAAHADVVQEGHNVVLRQAVGDAPLAFVQRWTTCGRQIRSGSSSTCTKPPGADVSRQTGCVRRSSAFEQAPSQ